jgi:hypothetical protein
MLPNDKKEWDFGFVAASPYASHPEISKLKEKN